MEVSLDADLFKLRIDRLRHIWNENLTKEGSSWNAVDALFFLSGRQDESTEASKINKFHLWIFGYVFPETLIVFLRNGLTYIITGPKKLLLLKKLVCNETLVLLEKCSMDGNKSNIETIVKSISSEYTKPKIRLGFLDGKVEESKGNFAAQITTEFSHHFHPEKFSRVSLNNEIAMLLAVLDKAALPLARKAATLAVRLTQEILITRIEDILDNETSETHWDIVNAAEEALDNPKFQQRWRTKYQLEPDDLDFIYANVQSGSINELSTSAVPTSKPLFTGPGTILISLGAKYQDYTANVTRTLLFNTTKEHRASYQFTLDVLMYGIQLLKPATVFKEIYKSIVEFVERENPYLFNYLVKSFGHAMGLEFQDSSLLIEENNDTVLCEGMIINLSVGFLNIKNRETNVTYSIWLSDTIEIQSNNEDPKILTADLDKRLKMVNYELSDDIPKGNEPKVKKESSEKKKVMEKKIESDKKLNIATEKKVKETERDTSDEEKMDTPEVRKTSVILRERLRSRGKSSNFEEVERQLSIQRALRKKKLEELEERVRSGKTADTYKSQKPVNKLTTITTYSDASAYPKDLKPNRLYLDTANEAILIPMLVTGHVPFHVAMIRNIICQAEEKKFYTIRIQFQVPGTLGFGYKTECNPFPEISGPNGMFIKEFIFRSSHPSIPQFCKGFKDLQKQIKQEQTTKTSTALAVTEPLEVTKRDGRRIFIKNVAMKTGSNTRRTPGVLEAYPNGLRYSGPRIETLDINYSTIKHAFFQPCENELIVLLHFHLKNPILVNKKKVFDIQFYTEIGAQMEDLDQRRVRSTYDADEILEEQREREHKQMLNSEFKHFVQAVEEMGRKFKHPIEFEIPYRDLGFYGVPKNSNQFIMPTARCLVQLLEWPVLVITLEEVELVSCERVYHGLRQFDMVFVFKNYSLPVRHITTVPIGSLDMIKRWLNEVEIVWYESKGNLVWAEILKTICDDFPGFVEDGGFGMFLDDEVPGDRKTSNNDSNNEDSSYDSTVSVTDSDDEDATEADESEDSSEESSDDTSLSLATERSESSASSANDESEEGLTWEELERQAIRDDRKREKTACDNDHANSNQMNRHSSKRKKM